MVKAVATGIGCVTPIGIGADVFGRALRDGESGIGPLTLCDPSPYQSKIAAEVRGFDPKQFMALREARSSPRVVQFAVAAARLALEHAGMRALSRPSRTAVIIGTSAGPAAYYAEQLAIFIERGVKRTHPSFPVNSHNGVVASEVAIQIGAHGNVLTCSSACTSGADAIGLAAAFIHNGMADVVIAGGAEAPIFPFLFASFDRLSMMPRHFNGCPERASRPFDVNREGFVLGEGAGIVVLEREDIALERGARRLAEVCGYGATCDAYNHFFQSDDGDDASRAIADAITQASAWDDLDYVNAHGSATISNDAFETKVLKRVLGARAKKVPASSTKSVIGHLLGASGAVELIATIIAMEKGFFPPTMNLDSPDPSCDLDYVPNESRSGVIRVALSMSFGFGSRNAALVVRRV